MAQSADLTQIDTSSDPPKLGDSEKKKKNRRGNSSKQNSMDKYRENQNKKFQDKIDKRIQDFKISLGYSTNELFGNRVATNIVHPPSQVPVRTEDIPELCRLTSEVLHTACKVAPPPAAPNDAVDYDAMTLMWVSALQVGAKVFAARAGSEYAPDVANQDLYQRVFSLLDEAVLPLGVYIDQIGRFTVSEQVFVPTHNGQADCIYPLLGLPGNELNRDFRLEGDELHEGEVNMNRLGPNGFPMHVRVINNEGALLARIIDGNGVFNPQFMDAPERFQYFGVVEFREVRLRHNPLPFPQVIERYSELRGRINKKLASGFTSLHLDKGVGSESQLVYRRETGFRPNLRGVVEAWSPRAVKEDALVMGALLGIGYVHQENPFSDINSCLVQASVDCAGALQTLAESLTRRVR